MEKFQIESNVKYRHIRQTFKGIFEDNIQNNFCIFSLLGGCGGGGWG
jgi:hypothetical protein